MSYYKVGKILKTHGLKGTLKVHFDELFFNQIIQLKGIFVEQHKGLEPFIIQHCEQAHDGTYWLNLEDINNVDIAKPLSNKSIFLRETDLSCYDEDGNFLLPFSIGFEVLGIRNKKIGKIIDVLDSGHQFIAKLIIENKEVLIPLIEEFIVNIDIENKVIKMKLPDGILNLN